MFHWTPDGSADPFGRTARVAPRFARCCTEDDPASAGGGGGQGEPAPEEAPDDEKQKLIAESRKYRRRAQEAESRLSQLEPLALDAEDLAEYRRLKEHDEQRQRRQQELTRQQERLLAELTEKHTGELAAANRRGEVLARQLCRAVGTDRLKSALAARGVTRVDQAAYLLQRHVRVELPDDEPAVKVVDDKGRPIVDPGSAPGETMSIERFVDCWLAEKGAHFLPPSGDTGSGAHKGGSADRADIADLEANPARRYAFIREHGTDEYLRRLGEWKRRHAAGK